LLKHWFDWMRRIGTSRLLLPLDGVG